MKAFELCGKKKRNGRRPFRMVLHEVYPDSCVDGNVGNQYNENGICWIEKYCENQMDSIRGMSLTCEFADPVKQDELLGHGDTGFEDGLPVFDNATIVGNFDKAYIDDVELNGEAHRCMIAEGTIDQMRCNNFVKYLEEQIKEGNPPHGSVEISRKVDHETIVYLNGKMEDGRIPVLFDYSGYALLGVRPADDTATILELNKNTWETEGKTMNEEVQNALDGLMQKINETFACKEDLNKCMEEKNKCQEDLNKCQEDLNKCQEEKNELMVESEKIRAALESAKVEREELNKKWMELSDECDRLREELGKALARERVNEMNTALAGFTEEQIAFAKDEKEAFDADPIHVEINTVVDKIYQMIGRKASEAERVLNEQNAKKEPNDIYAGVDLPGNDEDIFN